MFYCNRWLLKSVKIFCKNNCYLHAFKLKSGLPSLQFLATAVLEANDVIDGIHNSLDEQKQLVAFSIQQQEEVCSICLPLFGFVQFLCININKAMVIMQL